MSNSLLVMREGYVPFDRQQVADVIATFPDVHNAREHQGAGGSPMLIANCGAGDDACELWMDDRGGAIHILHPGDYGQQFARRLHEAFETRGLGGLELFDQGYSFHIRLRDGSDVRQP